MDKLILILLEKQVFDNKELASFLKYTWYFTIAFFFASFGFACLVCDHPIPSLYGFHGNRPYLK